MKMNIKLLYFKTYISAQILTLCHFSTHHFLYPATMDKTLHYFFETQQLSIPLQTKKAKQTLNIRKFLPLYINSETILFPLTTKRSTIQYYINAMAITGLKSLQYGTVIYFENTKYIEVTIPYTFVYKKWQESISLSHHSY